MPAGRPTKYRPEMCERVTRYMAEGASKEAAAGHLQITKDTLYRWIAKHPKFSDAVKLGESLSRAWWEELGRKAAMGQVDGFAATPWVFCMKNIHGWKDKQPEEEPPPPAVPTIVIKTNGGANGKSK